MSGNSSNLATDPKIDTLRNTLELLNMEFRKFSADKNVSAGSRVRKYAQQMKALLQEIRITVLEEQKKIKDGNKKK